MPKSFKEATMALAALLMSLAGSGCGGDPGADPAGRIDDACTAVKECVAESASCVDGGDGVKRCQSSCLGDKACGPGAACLFAKGDSVGECFRTCQTAVDCAAPGWRCDRFVSGSTQGYCRPPCRLSECSDEAFTYTCGSGSYSYDSYRTGSSSSTTLTYSNGHTVSCQSVAGHGSCHDDTSATCSF
jgi:hypothetical protein